MKIQYLPNQCSLALSGGIDSIFALDFLSVKKGRLISCIHINHGTPNANRYQEFCEKVCDKYKVKLEVYHYYQSQPASEALWHNFRYEVFHRYDQDVVVCHHKDDDLENRILFGHKIRPRNKNIIRPFLNVIKSEIINYVNFHNLSYIQDETNFDENYTKRNKIRRIVQELKDIGAPVYSLLNEIKQ